MLPPEQGKIEARQREVIGEPKAAKLLAHLLERGLGRRGVTAPLRKAPFDPAKAELVEGVAEPIGEAAGLGQWGRG